MNLKYRQTCRVCGSPHLKKVIDLGPQHLQGSFIKPGMDAPPMRKIPCVLLRCDPTADENGCGLLQMQHSVPPEVLYSSYWYRSGTNQTMRDHLDGIAKKAQSLLPQRSHTDPVSTVLDIGCNDGTLLQSFPEFEWHRFGVDPSDIASKIPIGVATVFRDTFPSSQMPDRHKFDVITSIAMFYDLEDPVGFARAIEKALTPEGIWVVEMSHMPTMLKNNGYDTICHEHLEYYSLSVIERICSMAGLRVFCAELNDSNGGSLRCYVQKATSMTSREPGDLKQIRQDEFDLELDTDKPYEDFQRRIAAHREDLRVLLHTLKQSGKVVHVYGASTKGNTLLQWCGIDTRLVSCAAERNPDKFGAMTIGTEIQIVSESQSRAMKPDYYLVLPWHFKDEFLKREQESLAAGVKFIFPLPKVSIEGL